MNLLIKMKKKTPNPISLLKTVLVIALVIGAVILPLPLAALSITYNMSAVTQNQDLAVTLDPTGVNIIDPSSYLWQTIITNGTELICYVQNFGNVPLSVTLTALPNTECNATYTVNGISTTYPHSLTFPIGAGGTVTIAIDFTDVVSGQIAQWSFTVTGS
jgi:hypothetical protein